VKKLFLGMFVVLASAGVWAQSINVDWDRNVHDFARYKTYAWVRPLRPTANPLMDERIVTAIDAQLAAKGMRKVDSGSDLLVTYNAGVKEQRSAMATGMGGWRMGMGRVDPIIENVGTLVVDLSDAGQKKLIWRGAASDTLSDKSDKNSKKIEKAVEKMFKKYPPK